MHTQDHASAQTWPRATWAPDKTVDNRTSALLYSVLLQMRRGPLVRRYLTPQADQIYIAVRLIIGNQTKANPLTWRK